MDCLFESRSSTGGAVFWAPLPPTPPSAQGPGFPPGVRASRPGGPYSLFRPGPVSRPGDQGPGIRSTSRTAFMGPVARARLSGARSPETGDQASRILPIPGDRGPGSGGRLPPGARGPGGHAFRLSGDRGQGLFGFFQDMILSLHLLFLAACINIHISRI